MRFIARFVVSNLSPRSAIRLGELLIEFGKVAEERLARVEKAVQSIRSATAELVK
jgi:hypothetical protein